MPFSYFLTILTHCYEIPFLCLCPCQPFLNLFPVLFLLRLGEGCRNECSIQGGDRMWIYRLQTICHLREKRKKFTVLCNFYHVCWFFIVSKCFKLLENKMKIFFVTCLFVHLLVVLLFNLSTVSTLLVWSACLAAFFQDLSFWCSPSCAVLWQLNPSE